MQMAAFSARSPYEIGDKIQVITPAGKNQDGAFTTYATITDIACTHYLRGNRVLFTYELDGSGEYIPLITAKEAGYQIEGQKEALKNLAIATNNFEI